MPDRRFQACKTTNAAQDFSQTIVRPFADRGRTARVSAEERRETKIDLAGESDFRLGALLIRPSTCQVVSSGVEERVEPRVMEVLVTLYRAQGQTVTRDRLVDACWDGRIVSEIYRNNSNASTRFIGWSMTKSVTSVLIGCALAENRIDSLDTLVSRYLPELKGGGYDGVSESSRS